MADTLRLAPTAGGLPRPDSGAQPDSHPQSQVKGLRYRWNPQHRYWARSLAAHGFDPDLLLGQDWAAQAERVVVIGESGEILLDHRPPRTRVAAGEATSGTA